MLSKAVLLHFQSLPYKLKMTIKDFQCEVLHVCHWRVEKPVVFLAYLFVLHVVVPSSTPQLEQRRHVVLFFKN